jgi:hypothetical protein
VSLSIAWNHSDRDNGATIKMGGCWFLVVLASTGLYVELGLGKTRQEIDRAYRLL